MTSTNTENHLSRVTCAKNSLTILLGAAEDVTLVMTEIGLPTEDAVSYAATTARKLGLRDGLVDRVCANWYID